MSAPHPLEPVTGSLRRRAVRRLIREAPDWVRRSAVRRCRAAVVTGTGRCGTAYTARLLRELGVRAGHEKVFRTGGYCYMPDAQVDSSWMAAPYLDQITSPVVHLVRDPIAVISSLTGIRFFSQPHDAYTRYAYDHCPSLTGDDELLDAVRWYVVWNRQIEHHVGEDCRVRIEDLADVRHVERFVDALGVSSTSEAIGRAVDAIPQTVNTRPRAGVSWRELRERCPGADVASLEEISTRYRYCPA